MKIKLKKNYLLVLLTTFAMQIFAQTGDVAIKTKATLPAKAKSITSPKSNFRTASTTACGNDTIAYTYEKETIFDADTFYVDYLVPNAGFTRTGSQAYEYSGAGLTVAGMQFYGALQNDAKPANGTMNVRAYLYNVDANFKPTSAIDSVTVTIDKNSLVYNVAFSQPRTVTGNYAVAVRTLATSVDTLVLYINNSGAFGNGLGEGLGYRRYGSGTWNTNLTYFAQDADWLMGPIVSYTNSADFTFSPSNPANTDLVTFTSTTDSSVLVSRFYNLNQFLTYWTGAPDSSYAYDFGDGSAYAWMPNATHTYTVGGTYNASLATILWKYDFTYCVDVKAIGITVSAIAGGQQIPLQSSLGTGIFVEGMMNVNNTFSVNAIDAPAGATDAYFALLDSNGVLIPNTTVQDNNGANGWSAVLDMGDASYNAYAYVEFYNGGTFLDSGLLALDITPRPDWLTSSLASPGTANATSVNSSSHIITVDGVYPVKNVSDVVESGVKFFGGESFGLATNDFRFDISYNYLTQQSTVSNVRYVYEPTVFGYPVATETINNGGLGANFNLNINPDFNLSAQANYSASKTLCDWRTPEKSFPVPGIPLIKIGVSMGVKLEGGVGCMLNYGYDTGSQSWGLTNDVNGVSSVAVGAALDANLRGSVNLINKRIASAEANLDGIGRVGIWDEFQTVPAIVDSIKFGGDFKITGSVELFGLASWIGSVFTGGQTRFEGQLWPSNNLPYVFGDGFPSSIDLSGFRLIDPTSNTYSAIWESEMPTYKPQPTLNTRNGNLSAVWIEEDTLTQLQYLVYSKLPSGTNCFNNDLVVISSDKTISNPKVSNFSNGDAIITWTMNRYSASTIPGGTTVEQYLDEQDIYLAIYDNAVDSIIYIAPINDSGNNRAEGEASVTVGTGTSAMITWLVEDAGVNTTDVYYINIDNTAGNWTVSGSPQKIVDLPGYNYKVNVAYVDPTVAVAAWINDADGIDSTLNNRIVGVNWDGVAWGAVSDIAPSVLGNNFEDLHMSFNNNYGGLVYTVREDMGNGVFLNLVEASIFDFGNNNWSTQNQFDIWNQDSVYKQPRVSISDNGLMSITFQSVHLFEGANSDQGKLNLYLKNLNNNSIPWTPVSSNNLQFFNDTNVFVWSMDAAFGSNDILYIITQEYDTLVGTTYTPTNGILIGDHELNQVLRSVQINSNLTVTEVPDPCNVPTGVKDILKNRPQDFGIKFKCYPNPSSYQTVFEYVVEKKSSTTIQIYDVSGRQVAQAINQVLEPGTYKTIFNTENLGNGIYMCSYTSGNKNKIEKLVVAH